ncbi:hypothetical protein RHODOSMS8_00966 [Rhodobiaceae bacterium]|nr:hypothetical protein RHODOSMS8_00966 [Rhodobiaceae bacterium]
MEQDKDQRTDEIRTQKGEVFTFEDGLLTGVEGVAAEKAKGLIGKTIEEVFSHE